MAGRSLTGQELQDLVDRYTRAINTRDTAAVLELLHPGAAYYDAFWRETCVGRDLQQYFADWFADDNDHYEQIGDLVIVDENSIALRYRAYDNNDEDREAYRGAEVFCLREGKILTISDYYCDPRQEALEEVVRLSATRHGAPKYATSGLSAQHRYEIRQQVSELLGTECVHLDADLTVHDLATRIGCTPAQFYSVLIAEFHADIDDSLIDQPWIPARNLLRTVARRSEPKEN